MQEEVPKEVGALIAFVRIAMYAMFGAVMLILLWVEVILVMEKLWPAVAVCTFVIGMYLDALIKHVILADFGA